MRFKPKIKFSYVFNLLLLAFLAWRIMPIYQANSAIENHVLTSRKYPISNTKALTEFPLKDANSIAIFWATWCAPCKLEMARLKLSVDQGHMRPDQVFAINMGEDPKIVRQFLLEAPYPFTFIDAYSIAQSLNIQSTPTLLMLEGEEIVSATSGISFSWLWRAEFFLSP